LEYQRALDEGVPLEQAWDTREKIGLAEKIILRPWEARFYQATH